MSKRGGIIWILGALLISAMGCEGSPSVEQTQAKVTSKAVNQVQVVDQAPAAWTRLYPWGAGVDQVGLRPARFEQPARGVDAVALGPRGAVYVLDAVNGRVMQVAPRVHQVASAPAHATYLAAGPQGAVAVYSPFAARVWIHAPGVQMGEIQVPRALRQIRGISLGQSRVVTAHHVLQESFRLGSPAAPRSLAGILQGKREGEYSLASGAGVAVVLNQDRHPVVQVLGTNRQGRSRPLRSHVMDGPVLAARIVGVAGHAVCLRLERRGAGQGFSVERRAVCVDARTGARLLDRDLPAPGRYLPHQELSVGDDPPRLGFIHPELDGLRVTVWPLTQGVAP